MTWPTFWLYTLTMAMTTYLIRMLPLTLMRKDVKSVFLRSFLHYVPYAVLAAMTVPAIFTATGDVRTALPGVIVAVILAWRGLGLVAVAGGACVAVALAQMLLPLL